MSGNTDAPAGQDGLRIPIVEEQLAFGTRVVETGRGVRIHKTVSEQPVTIDERLQRESVEVRRVPVDRLVEGGEPPAPRYEGDTLVVPVLEEVLVVERRLRVKEELHITRTRVEERYQDTVALKAERVEVERFDEGATPPAP
jgi:stress response protein YsnF